MNSKMIVLVAPREGHLHQVHVRARLVARRLPATRARLPASVAEHDDGVLGVGADDEDTLGLRQLVLSLSEREQNSGELAAVGRH